MSQLFPAIRAGGILSSRSIMVERRQSGLAQPQKAPRRVNDRMIVRVDDVIAAVMVSGQMKLPTRRSGCYPDNSSGSN